MVQSTEGLWFVWGLGLVWCLGFSNGLVVEAELQVACGDSRKNRNLRRELLSLFSSENKLTNKLHSILNKQHNPKISVLAKQTDTHLPQCRSGSLCTAVLLRPRHRETQTERQKPLALTLNPGILNE